MSKIQTIVIPCNFCDVRKALQGSTDALDRYNSGTKIQVAFPLMSADDRELILNGTCPDCYDKLYGKEE